jgi:hypothetical protein
MRQATERQAPVRPLLRVDLPVERIPRQGATPMKTKPKETTGMREIERMDQIGRSATSAWTRIKKAQSKLWGDWMVVGEGLMEGRRWAMQKAEANKPEGKAYIIAFGEWLQRYRLSDMDKSDRAKLLQLMEDRPAVEEWRASLTDWERRNLNNPVIVWRKWTAATRVKKPKPRTAGVSGAEHGRAKAVIEELQARIEELEEELRTSPAPAANGEGDLGAAQARVAELETELAQFRLRKADQREGLKCSFCSKSQHDVKYLIAGPNEAHICDECTKLCVEIVAEKRTAETKPSEPKKRSRRDRQISDEAKQELAEQTD